MKSLELGQSINSAQSIIFVGRLNKWCWWLHSLHNPPKLLLLMSFLFLSGLIYSSFLLLGNKKGGGRDDYDSDSDSDHGFVVYVCVFCRCVSWKARERRRNP